MNIHTSVESINKTDQEIKNSKVIISKQVQKRIHGLKQQEYIKIINNLTNQNNRLKNQVNQLNTKVDELLINRKMKKKQKNHQIEQQIAKIKKQLQIKYVSMNQLKTQIKKYQKNDLNQNKIIHMKQHESVLSSVQKELSFLDKEKKNLLQSLKINEQDLMEYQQPTNAEIKSRIQNLKQQNKKLKSQITDKNQKLKINEKDSIETINKYYNLKKSDNRQIKSVFQNRTKNKTIEDNKIGSLSEITILQKQVQQLRRKKKQAQKQLVNDKMIKESKKSRLQREIRQNLQLHKQLFKKRVKVINQLNMFEKRDQQYKQMLYQITNKQKIQYIQTEIQTQILNVKQYRKDWVGKTAGVTFNDGKYNQHKNLNYIKSVTIYKTAQNIVFTKFYYQNDKKGKYQSQLPFEASYLKKTESKKLSSKNNGYLVNLFIYLSDKKITKLDFKWSDGQISTLGTDEPNNIKFYFDIIQNERPLSMFGSVSYQGKNGYILQSLGCEISE